MLYLAFCQSLRPRAQRPNIGTSEVTEHLTVHG